MTLAWTPPKEPGSFGAFGRLITFTIAAVICALLVYLALTQRFSAIAQFFEEAVTFESVLEFKEPPPTPPPPQIQQRPPEAQRPTVANIDAPPTPTFEPVIETPPAPPAPAYIDATFLERPNGRDFERLFPRRALERAISGRVLLDCNVAANGRLSCAVASETPLGWGFGEASLRAAQQFRVAPATADGHPTSGGRIRVPMSWQIR
jgi:protein TonB